MTSRRTPRLSAALLGLTALLCVRAQASLESHSRHDLRPPAEVLARLTPETTPSESSEYRLFAEGEDFLP